MYCLISTASTLGSIPGWYASQGFHCRDNKVNAYTGILIYPYTHNLSSLCALHNQHKHLEISAVMFYTKYVVLLTQLCMDAYSSCTGAGVLPILQPCPHYSLPRIIIILQVTLTSQYPNKKDTDSFAPVSISFIHCFFNSVCRIIKKYKIFWGLLTFAVLLYIFLM